MFQCRRGQNLPSSPCTLSVKGRFFSSRKESFFTQKKRAEEQGGSLPGKTGVTLGTSADDCSLLPCRGCHPEKRLVDELWAQNGDGGTGGGHGASLGSSHTPSRCCRAGLLEIPRGVRGGEGFKSIQKTWKKPPEQQRSTAPITAQHPGDECTKQAALTRNRGRELEISV